MSRTQPGLTAAIRSRRTARRSRLDGVERLSDRLLNWASILDEQTLRQAENTATLPFIHPHVALMPDAHLVVI
jgi:RNA-splicing ligase RtcB